MSGREKVAGTYNKLGPKWYRFVGKNPHLTSVSFFLLNIDLDTIEQFIENGVYCNRSEAMRHYIRIGIIKDLKAEKLREVGI